MDGSEDEKLTSFALRLALTHPCRNPTRERNRSLSTEAAHGFRSTAAQAKLEAKKKVATKKAAAKKPTPVKEAQISTKKKTTTKLTRGPNPQSGPAMAPLLHPEEIMLQFTYKLKLTERVKAKCNRHVPRYNPRKRWPRRHISWPAAPPVSRSTTFRRPACERSMLHSARDSYVAGPAHGRVDANPDRVRLHPRRRSHPYKPKLGGWKWAAPCGLFFAFREITELEGSDPNSDQFISGLDPVKKIATTGLG